MHGFDTPKRRGGCGHGQKQKQDELDEETRALLEWCAEVETHLVAAGATVAEAQEHIEEQAEWYTDQYYDGLSPEEAARAALK